MQTRYETFLELQAQQTDECVLWPYGQNGHGYGRVDHDGTRYPTHRLSCTIAHGEPPFPKADAAHSCNNRACMNPRHLRWATRADNCADRISDGTANRGERHGNSKLTEYQVREMRIYARSGVTQQNLAAYYGVAPRAISMIVRGKRWGWLT